jgi:hypothetical protein
MKCNISLVLGPLNLSRFADRFRVHELVPVFRTKGRTNCGEMSLN